MTQRDDLRNHITAHPIIGVVREDDADDAWEVARCYAEHGIRTVEITMTTPDALALMTRVAEAYPEVVVAAGTVRGSNDAADARRAGARMLVSPHTDLRVIDYALENDLLCVAGAATATEIIHAWESGAGIIKIYPAGLLGGPEYIRTIQQPIRGIPMLAGGPIALEAIDAYLDAGAIAVNLGGSLAVPSLVATKDWNTIAQRVARAVGIVASRGELAFETSAVVH